jgi:DNA-binding response OmpR family regulator
MKILIVDDDPTMYRMYQTIFGMESFQVEVAVDGDSGLEKAKSFLPDVILLDIMMKTVNGLEVLKKLKADNGLHAIPVVVLSNVSDVTVINEAKANGAAQFVIKSNTEPADMVALVRALLAKLRTNAAAGGAPDVPAEGMVGGTPGNEESAPASTAAEEAPITDAAVPEADPDVMPQPPLQ